MASQYVMALDLGTTKVRSYIYNQEGKVVGHCTRKIDLLYPKPGWVEIGPDALWDSVQVVLKGALKFADISADNVTCLGISSQRATFVTWHKRTGKEFHNFITWKDVRSDSLVKEWNKSLTMKALRSGAGLLFFLTRMRRFRVASILSLQTKMVNMRLLWALNNIPSLKEAVKTDDAMFGTLDTWLLFKLSKGQQYLTDIASASATGLFDPFILDYAEWAFALFGIPMNLMPPVVDSAGNHFGSIDPEILGHAIPVRALMADQSAATFGSGCFSQGDTKMSLGTGSFLDVNTGITPHPSISGLIPVVGWRYRESLVYLAEGSNHDTGSLIEWSKHMQFFDEPSEASHVAESVEYDKIDLFFIPAFFGLQAPINDSTAGAGFIGITPQTGPNEMLKAILESIAFTMKQLQETMEEESEYQLHNIQVDGGVSRNDFVVQLISSLTGKHIHRATTTEMSAWGTAFLAGLDAGVWKSPSDLTEMRRIEKTYEPSRDPEYLKRLKSRYQKWVDACYRFTDWNLETT